jgi:hypothetical protein
MTTAERLIQIVLKLPEDQQQRLLRLAEHLESPPENLGERKGIMCLAGTLPDKDARQMREAIERDCEWGGTDR